MIFYPEFSHDDLPLQEYPRPQFRRDSYLPLNGRWEYAFTATATPPAHFNGEIIVPYSPESKLSGVCRQLGPEEFLHYRRHFTLPEGFFRGRVLLNIGACDQVCTVFLNGKKAGEHAGGYLPFSIDLTAALCDGENELHIVVQDDASSPIYGRGKQRYRNGGIWYTAVSGIWQSVWLESVPNAYLYDLTLLPDCAAERLYVSCRATGEGNVTYTVCDGDRVLSSASAPAGERTALDTSACSPWTPGRPELYRLVISFGEDRAESYFGMRSYACTQAGGRHYFALNGKAYFQNGLLDQGYWGDGIYTPRSNRNMYDCLCRVKALGFNMLRKHIKIEPLLWYYYCDILGILVWQDMINGGAQYSPFRLAACPFFDLHLNDKNYKSMGRGDARSRKQYLREAEETVRLLSPCVSVCLWTPFNEAWGQFDAIKVCEWIKSLDPSRPVDHASGWQDMGGGDVYSRHVYFRKVRLKNDGRRLLALTEFGGYTYSPAARGRSFGYRTFRSASAYARAVCALYRRQLVQNIAKAGLCAVVYTQLSDVEEERNGIFTRDMQPKIADEIWRTLNGELFAAFAAHIAENDR